MAPVIPTSVPEGPNFNTRFEGIDFTFQTTEFDMEVIPPDPSGAAGPSLVIAVVSRSIEARNRAGIRLWVALP
jgi:hypothetical protein